MSPFTPLVLSPFLTRFIDDLFGFGGSIIAAHICVCAVVVIIVLFIGLICATGHFVGDRVVTTFKRVFIRDFSFNVTVWLSRRPANSRYLQFLEAIQKRQRLGWLKMFRQPRSGILAKCR